MSDELRKRGTSVSARLVLLAAGGTGGHLFPAESLAVALSKRGITIDLATDERATRYGMTFPARTTHIIPSATVRGHNPILLAQTGMLLSLGKEEIVIHLNQ